MADASITQRLNQAFAASGLTQAELARAAGIDRASISLYLGGRYHPKADKLLRIAAALNVTPEWLSGLEVSAPETAAVLPVCTGLDAQGNPRPGDGTLSIPRSWLMDQPPEQFFVLAVSGLAMYPRILEGDLLLARRGDGVPEGGTAVLSQGGVLLVRTLRGGMLCPANPEFPPRELTPDCRVLGRVITLIRRT